MEDKYSSQKKYLASQKQLRVWVDPGKYEALKQKAFKEGISIYFLVNKWIDQYLSGEPGE